MLARILKVCGVILLAGACMPIITLAIMHAERFGWVQTICLNPFILIIVGYTCWCIGKELTKPQDERWR
jgi:hypothetical protein